MDANYWKEFIPMGEGNAIHMKDLAERIGISKHVLKARINRARREGVEICSSPKGYYFAINDDERQRFVRMQEGQAKMRFLTSGTSRKILNEYKGQMEITDDKTGGGVK